MYNNRPYENPIFTDILSQSFFHGSNAFITSHIPSFNVEWAGEVRQELPPVMVALVATAVSDQISLSAHRLMKAPGLGRSR